jgi:hypothetical protein
MCTILVIYFVISYIQHSLDLHVLFISEVRMYDVYAHVGIYVVL